MTIEVIHEQKLNNDMLLLLIILGNYIWPSQVQRWFLMCNIKIPVHYYTVSILVLH